MFKILVLFFFKKKEEFVWNASDTRKEKSHLKKYAIDKFVAKCGENPN